MLLPLNNAIDEFFGLFSKLSNDQELSIEKVVNMMSTYYSDVRIIHSDINKNEDMLLFQWGSYKILNNLKMVDLRKYLGKVIFSNVNYQYLDFTRQIYTYKNKEGDFDEALQMSIQLVYGLAKGDEPNSNMWIENPNDVKIKINKYLETSYIIDCKKKKINKIIAFVDSCG